MAEAYIIDAVRTPRGIGKQGKGALAHMHPQHLASTCLKAIKDRNDLDTATVDDVIWSVSTQDGMQAGDLGRMAALDAGYDVTSSGTTLDRFCGGGITSVALAAAQVMSGMEDCVVAGGTEMMSLTAQMSKDKMAAGLKPPMMGSYNERLQRLHPQSHQGVCGDAIATIEGFTREELDEVGYRSQQRAAQARSELSALRAFHVHVRRVVLLLGLLRVVAVGRRLALWAHFFVGDATGPRGRPRASAPPAARADDISARPIGRTRSPTRDDRAHDDSRAAPRGGSRR